MLNKLTNYFSTWQLRRQAAHQLASLSDHELNDIGVNRADIPYIVRKGTKG